MLHKQVIQNPLSSSTGTLMSLPQLTPTAALAYSEDPLGLSWESLTHF